MSHETINTVTATTQPIIFGVAGAHILGVSVQDWIMVGTGLLLVINLGLAGYKVWNIWRKRHG
jgi:hypothetical protein